MNKVDWHYPRSDFAEKVFTLLVDGPINAARLFGPRRMGKTEFLLRDLAELAESRGHRVVYASLWQHLGSPLAILLYEFYQAFRGRRITDQLKSVNASAKFEIKIPGLGKLTIDLGAKGPPPADQLLGLDLLCGKLENSRKPTFMLLDEVQELAKSDGAKELIAALRTSLDKRKSGLVTVFTGSSQAGLRAMFSDRDAPLFRFAEPLELPDLNSEFVAHQLRAFRAVSKSKISDKDAIDAFEHCEHNPLFFQKWLMKLALHPSITPEEAFVMLQNELAEEFGFRSLWLNLRPIQRAAARLIAESMQNIYSDTGISKIAEMTDETPPTTSQLQSAIKRLSRQGVIDREKSREPWAVSDPLLGAWIRARPESEL
jgi:hypothetical protein